MPETTGLIYVGPGFYAGVPARDLSAEEVKEFGGIKELIKDGYYVAPSKTTAKPAASKEGE